MPNRAREDLCNLLSYAEELLRISERVMADLSCDTFRVFHGCQIAGLEGVSAGYFEDEWLGIASLRETVSPLADFVLAA